MGHDQRGIAYFPPSVQTARLDSALLKISNSVSVFEGRYPGGGNVTSTIFHSEKEAFIFDSLLYPDDTRSLLEAVKRLNLRIVALVNTHWHIDHVAGNQLFRETSRIISHRLTSDLMRADSLDWVNTELKLDGRKKVRHVCPNEAVSDGSTLTVGNRSGVELLHTPGHTPDSIIGWLRSEDVVIAGDTVMEIPFFGYGDSRAQIESLRRVRSISKRGTKIVQGHGSVCGSRKLENDISYIQEVRRRTAEYVVSGKTAERASADIKLEDCVAKERYRLLSESFKSILWCHPENVRKIFSELKTANA